MDVCHTAGIQGRVPDIVPENAGQAEHCQQDRDQRGGENIVDDMDQGGADLLRLGRPPRRSSG